MAHACDWKAGRPARSIGVSKLLAALAMLLLSMPAMSADPRRFTPEEVDPYLQVQLPNEDVALAQSMVLGFGTGHFYAGHVPRGLLFAGIEGGGAILLASDDSSVNVVGYVLLVGGRILDAAMAPITARQRAAQMIRAGSAVRGPVLFRNPVHDDDVRR